MQDVGAIALRSLVGERLWTYCLRAETDVSLHGNAKLAQQVWPLVMFVELGLRNHLDSALRRCFPGRDEHQTWLLNPPPALNSVVHRVEKAKTRLVQRNSKVTHADLLDQLPFGFWSALLARRNVNQLWPDLSHAFSHAPSRLWREAGPRVGRIGRLRNHIAHHVPIDGLELSSGVADGLTLISYMAPAAVDPVRQIVGLGWLDES